METTQASKQFAFIEIQKCDFAILQTKQTVATNNSKQSRKSFPETKVASSLVVHFRNVF